MTSAQLVALALLLPIGAEAQTVVDGDTIRLNGTTYRLHGIDAPESKQACNQGWAAGQVAASRLRALMEGRKVVCEAKGSDRYGRTIAVCRADGEDLGAALVREGLAWAFTKYSLDYVTQESAARAAGLGVHRYACQPAWEYRKQ